MNTIEIKNLSKSFKIPSIARETVIEKIKGIFDGHYRKITLFNNLNLKICKGEAVGIIGPNGSGKTTLLKIIAGIIEKSRGQVKVRGKAVSFLESSIGFHRELTAEENIYLFGAIVGIKKERLRKRIRNIFDYSELHKFRNTKLKNFSTGMVSRLAFATVLHSDADILLLDEFLSALDQEFRKKCYATLERLKKEGKTIVYVSHNLDSVKKICDGVIELKKH